MLPALNALRQNPNFKKITVPEPVASLPSDGAARKDGDSRLTAFLQGWAYMSRTSGNIKKLILDSVKLSGLDASALPPEMEF
ncbi:MAG: hypothetical protein O3A88_03910 [Proteobacteria bacterium]|nr:hypothetical protein [Pseudomonadota bacterium]